MTALLLAALLTLVGLSTPPTGEVGEPLTAIRGTASWYCSDTSPCTRGYGPQSMVAAIDPSTGFRKGDVVTVTHGDAEVSVRIVDVCACAGSRVIDLTSGAFSRLAPLDRGVIPVTVEGASGPAPTLPPTDMEAPK